MDGEISPKEASKLQDYLESHPDAMDWMESADRSRTAAFENKDSVDTNSIWESVKKEIDSKASENDSSRSGKLIPFPALSRVLAAAAAIALVAVVSWFGLKSDPNAGVALASNESIVEFVDTEIPDASPIVYTDEESGWTVVWVAKLDPAPEDAG